VSSNARQWLAANRRIAVLILLLIANTIALVLIWEQPDCAASEDCHSSETLPKLLSESIPLFIGMSKELERAKGRSKNARNQLQNMRDELRKGNAVDDESVEYALQEVLAALEHIDTALWEQSDEE
jgi:hypothetical protein